MCCTFAEGFVRAKEHLLKLNVIKPLCFVQLLMDDVMVTLTGVGDVFSIPYALVLGFSLIVST